MRDPPSWAVTDDQLHAMWLRGASVAAIARQALRSTTSVRSRLKRLRAKEGEERWPVRQEPRPLPGHGVGRKGYQRKRAGPTTLPPLPSLER